MEQQRNIEAAALQRYGQFLPGRSDPKNAVTPPETIVMDEIVKLRKLAGVTGIDLTNLFRNLKYKAMKMKFLSKDPWSFFKFNRKFNYYRNLLLEAFNKN